MLYYYLLYTFFRRFSYNRRILRIIVSPSIGCRFRPWRFLTVFNNTNLRTSSIPQIFWMYFNVLLLKSLSDKSFVYVNTITYYLYIYRHTIETNDGMIIDVARRSDFFFQFFFFYKSHLQRKSSADTAVTVADRMCLISLHLNQSRGRTNYRIIDVVPVT